MTLADQTIEKIIKEVKRFTLPMPNFNVVVRCHLYPTDDCSGSYVRLPLTKSVFLRHGLVHQILRHLGGLQGESGLH